MWGLAGCGRDAGGGGESNVGFYDGQEFFFSKGLGEVFVGAYHPGFDPVNKAVFAGEHDHGSFAKLTGFAQHGAEFVAIKLGHGNIAEDQVWVDHEDLTKGFEGIANGGDLVAYVLEGVFDDALDGVAVVNT